MRTLDPGSRDSAASWKFCVDRLDVRLNGPIKEYVHHDDKPEMTEEEAREEERLIAIEHLAALSPEEREKLVRQPTITPGVGSETVQ